APYKTAIWALHCIIRTDDTFLIRARCKLTIRSRATHSTPVGAHLRVVCADNLSVRARCKLTIRTGTPDAAAIRTDFRLFGASNRAGIYFLAFFSRTGSKLTVGALATHSAPIGTDLRFQRASDGLLIHRTSAALPHGAHDAALSAAAFVAPIGRRKVVTHRVRAITCGCRYRTAVVCWAQTGARPGTGVAIARRF